MTYGRQLHIVGAACDDEKWGLGSSDAGEPSSLKVASGEARGNSSLVTVNAYANESVHTQKTV